MLKDLDEDCLIRNDLPKALGEIGGDVVIAHLEAALATPSDRGSWVSYNAAAQLAKMGGEQANAILAKNITPDERGLAVYLGGKSWGSISSQQAIEIAWAWVRGHDEWMEEHGGKALVGLLQKQKDVVSLTTLLNASTQSDDKLRKMAARALVDLGDPQGIQSLRKAIQDDRLGLNGWETRLWALGEIGDEECVRELMFFFYNKEFGRRERAQLVHSLGTAYKKSQYDEALGPILEGLTGDQDYFSCVADASAEELTKISIDAVGKAVRKALSSKNPTLLLRAIEVVGYYTHDQGVVKELVQLAQTHRNNKVQHDAKTALEQIRNKQRELGINIEVN